MSSNVTSKLYDMIENYIIGEWYITHGKKNNGRR